MDNHKGSRIDIINNSLNLRKLGKFGYDQKNFPWLMGKRTFTVEKGYTASDDFNNFLRDGRWLITDDDDILLVIETIGKSIGNFKADEGGQQGIECWFETKEKGRYAHQEDINDESRCADSNAVVFIEDSANDVCAPAAAADTVKKSSTDAIQGTADDTGEQSIFDWGQRNKETEKIKGKGISQHSEYRF